MIVPGILVCSSFLIIMCMFIVSKDLLLSSATVIVRAGGTIWLIFATVLFTVCSAVTVECVFCTRVAWVCLVCFQLCKEEGSSPVLLQLLRGRIWAYEVPLSLSLLGFGMRTMLANFHICGIMLVLRTVFNMLVRNVSPRGHVCLGA